MHHLLPLLAMATILPSEAQAGVETITLQSGKSVTFNVALPLGIKDALARDRSTLAGLDEAREAALRLALVDAPGDPAATAFALRLVSSTKGLSLEAGTRVALSIRQQGDAVGAAVVRDWADFQSRATSMSSTRPRDSGELGAMEATLAWLDEALLERAKEGGDSSVGDLVPLEQLRAMLPERGALLELIRFKPGKDEAPRYAALVLTPTGPPRAFDLGPAAPIEAAVTRLRALLVGGDEVRDAAQALDALTLRPLQGALSDVDQLLIAPDGALNLVPWAALQGPDGRWRAETWRISYLNSGRDLLRALTPMTPGSGPLLIADPDYGRAGGSLGGGRFGRLPGTATEADVIARVLPDVEVLIGASATEAALARRPGPSILHIATHGFVDGGGSQGGRGVAFAPAMAAGGGDEPAPTGDPLARVGLALAGANLGGASGLDGVLYGLEAATLDLRGTGLVVLSACETGLGEAVPGEGVYGLRRAFDLAGAESQVLSLWKVDDDATASLMTAFYEALAAGAGRAEALELASAALRAKRAYSHPRFWAAFVLAGMWGPLPAVQPTPTPARPEEGWAAPLAGALRALPSPAATASPETLGSLVDALFERSGPRLLGHLDPVRDVAWSQDSRRILTASADASARLWDARTGRLLTLIPGAYDLDAAALSPDGSLVATADALKTITLWRLPAGVRTFELKGATSRVRDLRFTPDGRQLLSVDADGAVRRWDVQTGLQRPGPPQIRTKLEEALFSPDASRVIVGGDDDIVRLLDTSNGATLATLPDDLLKATWALDGALVALRGSDGDQVWESATGRAWALPPKAQVVLAEGGRALVLEGEILRWWERGIVGAPIQMRKGMIGGRRSLYKLFPGGIVQAGPERIDLERRIAQADQLQYDLEPGDASISPDGSTALFLTEDDSATLYDLRPSTLNQTLEGGVSTSLRLSFSADGRRVLGLSSSRSCTPRIWDLESGRALVTGQWACEQPPNAMFFSPDGALVASTNTACLLWSAETGACQLSAAEARALYDWDPNAVPMSCERQDEDCWYSPGTPLAFSPDSQELLLKYQGFRWLDLSGRRLSPERYSGGRYKDLAEDGSLALMLDIRRCPPEGCDSDYGNLVASTVVLDTRTGKIVHDLGSFPKGDRVPLALYERSELLLIQEKLDTGRYTLLLYRLNPELKVVALEGAPVFKDSEAHCLSSDGQRLWARVDNRQELLWDTATGRLLAQAEASKGVGSALSAACPGRPIAVRASEGKETVIRVERPEGAPTILRLGPLAAAAERVELSPDARSLLLTLEGGTTLIFPFDAEALVAAACERLQGSAEAVPSICAP